MWQVNQNLKNENKVIAMKREYKEKEKGMLVKGKAAAKPQNMQYNKKVMEKAGYSPKRAEGAAYGEVGMEKMARRHESEGMKKAMDKKGLAPNRSPVKKY